MSQNRTVASFRRSGANTPNDAPQPGQNANPTGLSRPHEEQIGTKEA
jgi:hypothetical protein